MKTITKQIDLYEYNELSPEAQEKAVNDCINSWMEIPALVPLDAKEQYERAGQKSEQMQTPWFWGSYIWEYCKETILAECNLALYKQDGEFFGWKEESND